MVCTKKIPAGSTRQKAFLVKLVTFVQFYHSAQPGLWDISHGSFCNLSSGDGLGDLTFC